MEPLGDISALSSLLKESHDSLSKSESSEVKSMPSMSSGPTNVVSRQSTSNSHAPPSASSDIWGSEEIPLENDVKDLTDSRPAPKYDFFYKQSVGTEDTFLGLSSKTPGSSDCSHLVIKIHFPNATLKSLDIDVTNNRIRAESKTHRLFTYLPVNVNSDLGDAKFDSKKEVLTVTLPIIHEFD